MSDKYIIRNCPCYDANGDEYDCSWEYSKELYCQDCTDCILKQIVKKCKKSLEVSYCPIEQEILELLDIEECE